VCESPAEQRSWPTLLLDNWLSAHKDVTSAQRHREESRATVVAMDDSVAEAPGSHAFVPRADGALGATVVGTVDEDWRVDRLSADVIRLLDVAPESWVGASILKLVHPEDMAELLTTLGNAKAFGAGVRVELRFLDGQGCWQELLTQISPLGARPGFAFMLRQQTDRAADLDRTHELEQRLARIAREVHSAEAGRRPSDRPVPADLPELGRLTSREWEVVRQVRAGARVEEVARALHLSPSTVRNHLSAVYRKAGVRSIAELLVLLHAGVVSKPDRR
jgi:DNA-binding CsgD family transcriptional regulator